MRTCGEKEHHSRLSTYLEHKNAPNVQGKTTSRKPVSNPHLPTKNQRKPRHCQITIHLQLLYAPPGNRRLCHVRVQQVLHGHRGRPRNRRSSAVDGSLGRGDELGELVFFLRLTDCWRRWRRRCFLRFDKKKSIVGNESGGVSVDGGVRSACAPAARGEAGETLQLRAFFLVFFCRFGERADVKKKMPRF